MTPLQGFRTAFAALLACTVFPAAAEVSVAEAPPYTVRANAVVSTLLPKETATAHGIRQDDHVGVLNVVVLRGPAPDATVPAAVEAKFSGPGRAREAIAMRPVRAGGEVSYMGTFFVIDPSLTHRFEVKVKPADAPAVLLQFRQQIGAGP